MGKKKKSTKKASSKTSSRGPSAPPSSRKSGGKKRTSEKSGGGAMSAVSDILGNFDMSNLPALPGVSSNAPNVRAPKISFTSGGQMRLGAPRRKSRKGLSGSDIKGFLRVHKFAGMMTKVTGTKHRAVPRKKKRSSY